MKMLRLNIQLPLTLKAQLDAMRVQGYTAAGYIRAILERELSNNSTYRQKGR